eukprot:5178161-Alexandrium_andersonii.AAC.1
MAALDHSCNRRGRGGGGVGGGGAATFSSAACAFQRGRRPKARFSAVVIGVQFLQRGARLSPHAALLGDQALMPRNTGRRR